MSTATLPRQLVRGAATDALQDIAPILLGVTPFGVVVGVAMADAAIDLPTGLATSVLVYSGSAQLVVLALVGSGAGWVVAVLGAAIASARLMLYGAAMSASFRDQPAWFRWLGPFTIVDQTYAMATNRTDLHDPTRFRHYWLSAGAALTVAWLAAVAAGMQLGPVLPAGTPLEVTGMALFIALLIPRLTDRANMTAAAVAAAVTALAMHLPNGIGVLVGIVAGVAGALMITTRRTP